MLKLSYDEKIWLWITAWFWKEWGYDPKVLRGSLTRVSNALWSCYCDASGPTFGNSYKSALAAGYSDLTARNMTHNKPAWYSEKLGQIKVMEPMDLLAKLSAIIADSSEPTVIKLKAIDMLLKVNGMYRPDVHSITQINIQNVLDWPL